jgi:hypothetical protein
VAVAVTLPAYGQSQAVDLGGPTTASVRAAGEGSAPKPGTLLSLDPAAPELLSLPGGVTPAFGAVSTRPADWRFDFHGMLYVPLRVGFNTRDKPTSDEATHVYHAPPVVPDEFTSFGYTNVAPDPWAQLNFSYGNRDVTATVIIAARSVTEGASYFNPPDQLGINDAFLTFRIANTEHLHVKVDAGAFANRYGNMGEYDSGRYGTPIIARIGGVGITETGAYSFGPLTLMMEVGLMGQLNKAPLGVEPAGWNGYLDPNAGTSFVPHVHLGASYGGWAQLGLHAMRALSQDDRATPAQQPDGYIDITAADARLSLHRFGHLYAAVSETNSHHARAVSDIIQILNAPGGLGLMAEYFGPQSEGSGDLTTVGAQYDLSLGNLLRYPRLFDGLGPDLVASLFTIFTSVDSHDPAYSGKKKLKYGAEVSYSPLSWLALSGRYDRVIRDIDDGALTSAVLTPRLIFRTGYNARDQIVVEYSHWFNGSDVRVHTAPFGQRELAAAGGPALMQDTLVRPDADVLSVMASMWW